MTTKKYKVSWSLWNILSAGNEQVVKLQNLWATFTGIVTGSTFVMSSDRNTLYVMMAGFIFEKLFINGLDFEERVPKIHKPKDGHEDDANRLP